jgi:hypothetical protein
MSFRISMQTQSPSLTPRERNPPAISETRLSISSKPRWREPLMMPVDAAMMISRLASLYAHL